MTLLGPRTTTTPRHPARRAAALAARLITTPLLPSDFVELVAPLQSSRQRHGRVVEIAPAGSRTTRVVLQAGRGWQPHRAGQHVRIGFRIDGVWTWRPYSLTHESRAPHTRSGALIEVGVGAVGGVVSTHVQRDLAVGDLVLLDQPSGTFGLPDVLPERVLFLTAGSGITPVIGMLRSHLHELPDVTVVHSIRDAEALAFGTELRSWHDRGRIRLVLRHTAEQGRLDLDRLADVVPDWRERETWLCAPGSLVASAEQVWTAAGLADALHVEQFRPLLPVVAEGGEVSFTASGRTVEASGTTSLLDAGEGSGVLMPSGCRMGICYSCVSPLTRGSVRDLRTGAVTSATDEPIPVQTCINAAAGPCSIDR